MSRAASDAIPAVVACMSARFATVTSEEELQAQLARALEAAGIPFEREVRLSARDRVDFMAFDCVAIELKIKPTPKSLLRQVLRYAEHDRVTAIVVGAVTHHALQIPRELSGKPVVAVQMRTW